MEWYWIVLIVTGSLVMWFTLSTVFYKQFFKRFYDFTLSLLALIVLSPLLVILTIIGAIAMKGNPFFVQERPGKINKKTGKEKLFKLIKFRTMSNQKDKNGNLLPDEQRLNRFGRKCRMLSIDELPELICILIGNMSIVGPRPLLKEYLPWYTKDERRRHIVRPGLTGWAQVCGRNDLCWDQRFKADTFYVDNYSLLFDLRIILLTIKKVFSHEGVAENTREVEPNFAEQRRERLNDKKEVGK